MLTSVDRSSSANTLSSSSRRSNYNPEEELRSWRSSSSLYGRNSKATALKNVKNVQQSIMLLGNLVKDKRRTARHIDEKEVDAISIITDSAVNESSEGSDRLVRLVPFIDPVVRYRTSSPCRSNFRTLSTITQFRRSVTLDRTHSLSSIHSTSALSLNSDLLTGNSYSNRERNLTRPDYYQRQKRASLDQSSVNKRHSLSYPIIKHVSRQTIASNCTDDRCAAQHVPVRGSKIFTAHREDSPKREEQPYRSPARGLLSNVQRDAQTIRSTNICPDDRSAAQHVPPRAQHVPVRAQHVLTRASDDVGSNSNISNISNLTPRTRRRLFNRRRGSERSEERGGSHASGTNIEKVCIERWMSDFPASQQQNTATESVTSSSTGRNWSFTTRNLEDDSYEPSGTGLEYSSLDGISFSSPLKVRPTNASTPVLSSSGVTPCSNMDEYLCNCQFEPHEYCVFHNNIKESEWGNNMSGTGIQTDRNRSEADPTPADTDDGPLTNGKLSNKHRQNSSTFNHYNSLVTITLEDIESEYHHRSDQNVCEIANALQDIIDSDTDTDKATRSAESDHKVLPRLDTVQKTKVPETPPASDDQVKPSLGTDNETISSEKLPATDPQELPTLGAYQKTKSSEILSTTNPLHQSSISPTNPLYYRSSINPTSPIHHSSISPTNPLYYRSSINPTSPIHHSSISPTNPLHQSSISPPHKSSFSPTNPPHQSSFSPTNPLDQSSIIPTNPLDQSSIIPTSPPYRFSISPPCRSSISPTNPPHKSSISPTNPLHQSSISPTNPPYRSSISPTSPPRHSSISPPYRSSISITNPLNQSSISPTNSLHQPSINPIIPTIRYQPTNPQPESEPPSDNPSTPLQKEPTASNCRPSSMLSTQSISPGPRCALSPNIGDIPKVRTPCLEEMEQLSEDSFFTDSDSNSLIGNIVSNMLGI